MTKTNRCPECLTMPISRIPAHTSKCSRAESNHTKTKEAKHTPGPWKFKTSNNLMGDKRAIQIVKSSRQIAEVMVINEPIDQEANARLIAAAPDLLAAAMEHMTIIAKGYWAGSVVGEKSLSKLRAAISKAEGNE